MKIYQLLQHQEVHLGGGTIVNGVNLLTPYRKNTFVGDGTSTDYYLDTYGSNLEVTKVLVNDEEVTDYTVTATLGKVTFTTAPSEPALLGNANVEITFKKEVEGYKELITTAKVVATFDNRIFFSGNSTEPNYIRWCYVNRPEYISDLYYKGLGTNDNSVQAMVGGNNTLWVFKTDDQNRDTIFYLTPYADVSLGRTYVSQQGNVSMGCCSKGLNFKDNICFFSRQGLEKMSGSVGYEQSVTHASSMVDSKMIAESDYETLKVCEYKGFMIVAIKNHIYLADYRQLFTGTNGKEFEWYYWELPVNITCLREYLGNLYFGTDNGKICKMEGTNDDGAMIEAYWTTPRDFFGASYANHYKKTNKRGSLLKAKNVQNGKIKIAVRTNKETDWTQVKEASTNGFSFKTSNTEQETSKQGTFDFANFTFVSGDYSYIIYRAKKKKFIDLQTKFYLDDEIDENGKHINLDKPFGIALVEIENFLGGYAKR